MVDVAKVNMFGLSVGTFSWDDRYGRALFEKWLSLTGRTSGNPIESLCFLGKRCMGALEFEPAIGLSTGPELK